MSEDIYTCGNCGGTFEKAWSDDESDAEARQMFGEIPAEEKAVVCDDCYRAMMQWYSSAAPNN